MTRQKWMIIVCLVENGPPGRTERRTAMNIVDAMHTYQSLKLTENGALCRNTSGSFLLDLFAMGGAMRSRDEEEIETLFLRGFAENPDLAMKLLFYIRDVRGGLGERSTGRILLKTCAQVFPDVLRPLLPEIQEYGRWDDLLSLRSTPLEKDAVAILKAQLEKDCENLKEDRGISLLAKWLPSVNASSSDTKKTAQWLAYAFGMKAREYRRLLSALRARLNLTERNLSMGMDEKIRYSEVPSCAMRRYGAAFSRRDAERFGAFLNSVKNGTASVHSGVLYPYELAEMILNRDSICLESVEAQWNALPDFTEKGSRFLIMADVSGSMTGRPMAASVGLALYFAERCPGLFHNRFLTFSSQPELVEIKGDTLAQKLHSIGSANWNMNTDLESAFRLVLESAVSAGIPQQEMPESIVVITDMEIDSCTDGRPFLEGMRMQYAMHGYQLPNIVFWNVCARWNTFHAGDTEHGVQLVSGLTARVFESLAKGIVLTPYEYMTEVLSSARYAGIRADLSKTCA